MAADLDVAFTTIDTRNSERFQSLRRELGVSSFGMNVITLAPRQRGRIHAHERQEEVFVVLEGELTIAIEGEEHAVAKHGAVRVAPSVRRQLVNRGSSTLILLALGAEGDHVGRDGRAWEAWDEDGEGRAPQEVPLPSDLPV
ncbi:MAG TPA: cupin domain-containing protein [Baekduia sp.]|uniref:cupin domain-containing protein n=1 Tax=Baekduia sp. TaxID=2600305 RepID=UPI002D79927E|nr:cupin domain-containing protein [Baekduia sp.]HET6505202.1 cupin domain-containing protein [Baekduia sp.]